jgi:hypothetical protein
MQVLVSFAKIDHNTSRAAVAMKGIRQLFQGKRSQPISSEQIDWEIARDRYGGWEETYAWAAGHFAALIVVETSASALGRGQTDLVQRFIAAGKRAAVYRDGQVYRLTGVRKLAKDERQADWKSAFAVPILEY